MNNVKKYFSIRDLENLSGIKAHTIRIWEKRYNLLQPERTATNIRSYSIASLQKLLNIVILYNKGHKISKIAKIPEKNIPVLVREIISNTSKTSGAINAFKLAMINFDQSLFLNTYDSILSEKSFKEVFKEVFIPLLNELGLLWQTNSISAAHEHFVTALIKQKIIVNTEVVQKNDVVKKDKIFVPFLPENEIHEIGLLYLNYEIILKGYKSIYLGQTVPLDTLNDVIKYFDNVYLLSYFTVAPDKNKIKKYIQEFIDLSKDYSNTNLWILGYQTIHLTASDLPKNISLFTSIEQVLEKI